MRIVLLGATGTTGQHVLRQALAAGHEVVAYVRHASKLSERSQQLRVVQGQLFNGESLARALQGTQALISTLGVALSSPHHPPARQLPTILEAMEQAHVARYIGLSAAVVKVPGDHLPLLAWMATRLWRILRPTTTADKRQEYAILSSQTAVDWTLARPPLMLGHTLTQRYQADLHTPKKLWVSHADVAHFLISQLTDKHWSRQAPFVA